MVLLDVVLEEVLEVCFTNQTLKIMKELESFLIWDCTERAVWVASLKNWMDTCKGVIPAIVIHGINQVSVSKESGNISKVLSMEL